MSAQQEVANALSMMVPAAWVLTSWRCWGGALTLRSCLLVSSICCHMPLSVYYHMRVALSKMGVWRLSCTLDNTPRRLDQTGILLITSIAAYALSADHLLFAVCACAFNAHAILLLWQREMAPRRNQRDAIISATLIVWPMVRRCDWANFATAVAYALPGVYCFAQYPFGCALALCTPRSPTISPCAPQQHPSGHTLTPCALSVRLFVCSGYSHAIFHVLLGGLFDALIASSQSLEQTLEQGESQLTFRLIHANAWPASNATVAPFRAHYCLHT